MLLVIVVILFYLIGRILNNSFGWRYKKISGTVHSCKRIATGDGDAFEVSYKVSLAGESLLVKDEWLRGEISEGLEVELIIIEERPLVVRVDSIFSRISHELFGVLVLILILGWLEYYN